ncbi:hypothetical protein ACM9HF_19430 [Colwellia sp. RE-S-Sl-9]
MARANNSFWHRYKYKLNALVLILPFYFLYQSLTPEFPKDWGTKKIGSFEITLTPYDLAQPYIHGGHYTKDFMLIFSGGDLKHIRQAYLNIGEEPLPLARLQAGDEGILHGSQHGQEVHGIAPPTLKPEHKAWLTIEDWQGEQLVTKWDLPEKLTAQ